LSTPPVGGVAFISPDLTGGLKSGYSIVVTGSGLVVLPAINTCNAAADSRSSYLVTATPMSVGQTGNRAFGSDQRGTIYQDYTGAILVAPLVPAGMVSIVQ
jgi:hypothetical protein